MHYFTACISPEPVLADDQGNRGDSGNQGALIHQQKGGLVQNSSPPRLRIGNGLQKAPNAPAFAFSSNQPSYAHDQLPSSHRDGRLNGSFLEPVNDTDEHPNQNRYVTTYPSRAAADVQRNRQNESVYQSVERYKRSGDVTVSKITRIRNAKSADRSIFDDYEGSRVGASQAFPRSRHEDLHKGLSGSVIYANQGQNGNPLSESFHSRYEASQASQQSVLSAEQLSAVASVVANESVANKKQDGGNSWLRRPSNSSTHSIYPSTGANSFHATSFHKRGVSTISEACQTTVKKYRDEIASINNVILQVEEQIVSYNITINDLKRRVTTLREKRQQYEDILPIMSSRIREIERIKAAMFVQKSQSQEGGWGILGLFNSPSPSTEEYIFEEPEVIAMRTAHRLFEMGVFNPQTGYLSPRATHTGTEVHVTPVELSQNGSETEISNLLQKIRTLKQMLDRG